MTPEELQEVMTTHGLLQVDVARICAVTPRTVQNWLRGRQQIPKPLALILSALDEGLVDLNWIAAKMTD